MKLLITGASGLVGSKLSELAIQKDHKVYSAYVEHKPQHGEPVLLDVSDRESIIRTFERTAPDAVVHTAALTDVDRCERERELAWRINVEGTRSIAEYCKEHHTFLVYISTDYVFDGEKGMFSENDKPNPVNYYGLTKLKGEDAIRNGVEEHCIARASVIYGRTPSTGKTNFALWVIERLQKKNIVKVTADQWNSPTLNSNLATMILEVIERKLVGTLHLAGATRLSRLEFATRLAHNLSLDTTLITPVFSEELQWVARRPRDSSLNVEDAMRKLEHKPMRIEEALDELKKEIESASSSIVS